MEQIQNLLETGTIAWVTALLLGLLTAISPCPLATNIAAIGYLSKDIENRRHVLWKGVLFAAGKIAAYTLLAWAILWLLHKGASTFGLQQTLATWGEKLLGPLLAVIGAVLLLDDKIRLPGISLNIRRPASRGMAGSLLLGMVLSLAFCPTSALLYFGGLIPLSAGVSYGWALPILYAAATAVPVLIAAWLIAFSIRNVGRFMGRMKTLQTWLNRIIGVLFVLTGAYYIVIVLL